MGRGPDWRNVRRLFCGAMAAALVLSAAACTAAELPSAATSNAGVTESQTAAWTPQLVGPTPEASPAVTPEASATSSYVTAPTEATTAAPVALSSVAPLPAGKWKSLHWTQVTTPPAFVQAEARLSGDFNGQFSVFGWSRGYVAFGVGASANTSDIYTLSSADGVHWQGGQVLKFAGIVYISGVVEGPAGLLAVGTYVPSMCGGTPDVAAAWRSTDGITWRQVAVFSVDAGAVDGGSAGYIATGNLSRDVNDAWLSLDGATWKHVDLTASAFKGVQAIESGTAFSGGYVIAGAATVGGEGGCGGGSATLTGSLWWSADGTSWFRDSLSGTTPGDQVSMNVCRISDHALLASESSSNSTTNVTVNSYWISTDGRAWRSAVLPWLENSYRCMSVLTNGQRGLLVEPPSLNYGAGGQEAAQVVPSGIYAFEDDLSLVKLAQTGDGPDDAWANEGTTQALGPTGLVVVTTDGSSLWFGVLGD